MIDDLDQFGPWKHHENRFGYLACLELWGGPSELDLFGLRLVSKRYIYKQKKRFGVESNKISSSRVLLNFSTDL